MFKITRRSTKLIVVLSLVALLSACTGSATVSNQPNNAAAAMIVDGIKCEPASAATFNNSFSFSYQLTATESLAFPPARLGYLGDCRFWVYTDAVDGKIQVSPPVPFQPTLGAVLDIWRNTLPTDPVPAQLVKLLAAGHFTINGLPPIPNEQDWTSLTIKPDDQIKVGP
jgi:hypothetical protein